MSLCKERDFIPNYIILSLKAKRLCYLAQILIFTAGKNFSDEICKRC